MSLFDTGHLSAGHTGHLSAGQPDGQPPLLRGVLSGVPVRSQIRHRTDDYVTLRDGVVFPRAVIALALDLEARGIALSVVDGRLIARPADQVTDADATAIRAHRHALIAWTRYVDAWNAP